jgi:hypothetical protein
MASADKNNRLLVASGTPPDNCHTGHEQTRAASPGIQKFFQEGGAGMYFAAPLPQKA